jgi:hypothetical protein
MQCDAVGLGFSRFARRYSGNTSLFIFLPVLRCFTSRGKLLFDYSNRSHGFTMRGFPIRKSPDQRLLGTSPKCIAADRVLHRHIEPRHPPYALRSPVRKSKNLYNFFTPHSVPQSGMRRRATIHPIHLHASGLPVFLNSLQYEVVNVHQLSYENKIRLAGGSFGTSTFVQGLRASAVGSGKVNS